MKDIEGTFVIVRCTGGGMDRETAPVPGPPGALVICADVDADAATDMANLSGA